MYSRIPFRLLSDSEGLYLHVSIVWLDGVVMLSCIACICQVVGDSAIIDNDLHCRQ